MRPAARSIAPPAASPPSARVSVAPELRTLLLGEVREDAPRTDRDIVPRSTACDRDRVARRGLRPSWSTTCSGPTRRSSRCSRRRSATRGRCRCCCSGCRASRFGHCRRSRSPAWTRGRCGRSPRRCSAAAEPPPTPCGRRWLAPTATPYSSRSWSGCSSSVAPSAWSATPGGWPGPTQSMRSRRRSGL